MFSPKDPNEVVTVTFDFTNLASSVSVSSVNVTVMSGTDGNPNAMKSGAATTSGAKVLQSITGGISGNAYKITCTVTSGANTWVLADTMFVVPS